MAEIRVFVISGPLEGSLCFIIFPPPPNPTPHVCGLGREEGEVAVLLSCIRPSSSLSSLSFLTFCVMTIFPLTPHPSLCLAFRRMPEFQPSLAASVTYRINYSLFPGVQRKVQSCLPILLPVLPNLDAGWCGSVGPPARVSFWCLHLLMGSFSSLSACVYGGHLSLALAAIPPTGPSKKPVQSFLIPSHYCFPVAHLSLPPILTTGVLDFSYLQVAGNQLDFLIM